MDPTGSGWVILAHPPHNNLPLFDGELGEGGRGGSDQSVTVNDSTVNSFIFS